MTDFERYQFECATLALSLYYESLISALEQAAREKFPIRAGAIRRWKALTPEEQRIWLREAGQELTARGITLLSSVSDENRQYSMFSDRFGPNVKDMKPY